MIVLDVQNIAMRHGNNKSFNCKGIKIVIDYWQAKGHEVIGFLPDYLFNKQEVEQQIPHISEVKKIDHQNKASGDNSIEQID